MFNSGKWFLVTLLLLSMACNNSTDKKQGADMVRAHENAAHNSSAKVAENVKRIAPTFANVDAKNTQAFVSLIDKYLQLKNALAVNNEDEAKEKGKDMLDAISKIDQSTLTPEQQKVFASEEEDLKENAEHIGKSKLDHQRIHFSILSQSIYVIARSFGAGKSLYHLYCSKAEGREGAMWLSETIDSNNPYLGKEANCSEVIERIK